MTLSYPDNPCSAYNSSICLEHGEYRPVEVPRSHRADSPMGITAFLARQEVVPPWRLA
jgi:hypothetical protein